MERHMELQMELQKMLLQIQLDGIGLDQGGGLDQAAFPALNVREYAKPFCFLLFLDARMDFRMMFNLMFMLVDGLLRVVDGCRDLLKN